jgi:integrase
MLQHRNVRFNTNSPNPFYRGCPMPRLIHQLPKYRRHKASNQAVVSLAGKEVYLGRWRSKESKQEYARIVNEYVARDRQPPPAAKEEITVVELAAFYWSHCKRFYVRDGVATTEQRSIKDALKLVKELYGRTPAVAFGPLSLEAVREAMVAKDWSRNTVNCRSDRVRRMFKWGVSKELIPVTVYQALAAVDRLKRGRTTARESAGVQPVADAIVQRTLPHLPPIVCDMVRVQRLTGMRPNEVCIMRPCDIDRSGEIWLYRPRVHKTDWRGKERVILIGPRAQAVLAPYLLRECETYCFVPEEAERQRQGERRARKTTTRNRSRRWHRRFNPYYGTRSYGSAIGRACDRAGVEKWSPNRLRHSAATEIRKECGSLEDARVVLGHSSTSTSEIYAERDMEKAKAIMLKLG